MLRYPIRLTKDDNGTYLVDVPDVPEAHTFGETKDDAKRHALDVILTAFDARMRDKEPIPVPSPATRSRMYVDLPPIDVAKIALYTTMQEQRIGKAALAKRLDWHLAQLSRVLTLRYQSKFSQIEQALEAVGKRIVLDVENLSTSERTS